MYDPIESHVDPYGVTHAYNKLVDFIGNVDALKERERGGTMRLCSSVIEAKDADVIGDEPILQNGSVVGWVTSGGNAHGAGKSMAHGYVPKNIANDDSGWSIELFGGKFSRQTPEVSSI